MANPFKPTNGYVDKPKRNTYDLSYTSHITANFGTLYPVFCKKVSPGDSFSIQTVFGLRAQPMIFPIQTAMRADVHFYYVRNRTLWNNFMDFFGRTKENISHPYIDRPVSDFKTGSIYDYFGVPTTISEGGTYTETQTFNPWNIAQANFSGFNNANSGITAVQNYDINTFVQGGKLAKISRNVRNYSNFKPYFWTDEVTSLSILYHFGYGGIFGDSYVSYMGIPTSYFKMPPHFTEDSFVFDLPNAVLPASLNGSELFGNIYFLLKGYSHESNASLAHTTMAHGSNSNKATWEVPFILTYNDRLRYWQLICVTPEPLVNTMNNMNEHDLASHFCIVFYYNKDDGKLNDVFSTQHTSLTEEYQGLGDIICYNSSTDKTIDSSTLSSLPWCGPNKQLKLNALPYRAYEAIYNAYYRNAQVDPFKINGVAEYNKYVTRQGDGADDFPYKLYQRRYEYDFLTGALHSPQQGVAPLVGLTVNNANETATFKFQSSQINNGALITATTKINTEGEVVGIEGYDPNLPQSNLDRLMQAINYGISINDIRQTSAFQRWLEKNIRRGYKYKDQMLSHFGVQISYKDLLMPEFIGGASEQIKTDAIYQTVTNDNGYLGDFAGRGAVAGQSNHYIHKYCDESGFIIGILSIVPTPVYSQVPAGYAFDTNLFDYFFPEFSRIGMQPIYNYQVTPLQSQSKLNEVFGYQRPYWDLIGSIDEVHGEFRNSASGYLIQRQFAETPILNGNFVNINNDHLNDVFMITDETVSNQFLGMMKFKVTKKTAIPLHGEPSVV